MKLSQMDFNENKLNRIELKSILGGIDPPKDPVTPITSPISSPPIGNV